MGVGGCNKTPGSTHLSDTAATHLPMHGMASPVVVVHDDNNMIKTVVAWCCKIKYTGQEDIISYNNQTHRCVSPSSSHHTCTPPHIPSLIPVHTPCCMVLHHRPPTHQKAQSHGTPPHPSQHAHHHPHPVPHQAVIHMHCAADTALWGWEQVVLGAGVLCAGGVGSIVVPCMHTQNTSSHT